MSLIAGLGHLSISTQDWYLQREGFFFPAVNLCFIMVLHQDNKGTPSHWSWQNQGFPFKTVRSSLISAIPNLEVGRDAASVRGRSYRISETKPLPALTQCLIQQELKAFTERAEKKDSMFNTTSMEPWTGFLSILSFAVCLICCKN